MRRSKYTEEQKKSPLCRVRYCMYVTALVFSILWFSNKCLHAGPSLSTPTHTSQWNHLVCVTSQKDRTIACHRAGYGQVSLQRTTKWQFAEPFPSSLYVSRDRKSVYVGGLFDNNNCSVTVYRVVKDSSLKEIGFCLTSDAPALSFFEPSYGRSFYISKLGSILRYRSSGLADLHKEPEIIVPPLTSKRSDPRQSLALYKPDSSGTLRLKRSGAKYGEIANFEVAVASPGQYQLYYGGKLVSVSNVVYVVRPTVPSVGVCTIARGPRLLSQMQEIKLPDVLPKDFYKDAVAALSPDKKSLYVSTSRSGLNKLYQFAIRSNGSLLWRVNQTVTLPNSVVRAITFSPDKKYIYILDEGGGFTGGRICMFPLNPDGTIKRGSGTFVPTVPRPVALAVLSHQ